MNSILNKVLQRVKEVYYRAEDLLEDEKELPLSQNFINATMRKYVTDKVSMLDDLHADLYDEWLRLFATINYKGVQATLSTDLLLIQFQMDQEVQRFVFEQKGHTNVIDIYFDQRWKKLAFELAVYFFHRVLHQDLLPLILKKLNIVTLKYDLIYLDLAPYLADNEKLMRTLRKVQVNHAVLRPEQLVLKANINLKAMFGLDEQAPQQDDQDDWQPNRPIRTVSPD